MYNYIHADNAIATDASTMTRPEIAMSSAMIVCILFILVYLYIYYPMHIVFILYERSAYEVERSNVSTKIISYVFVCDELVYIETPKKCDE